MDKAQVYYEKMTQTPVSKLIVSLGIPTTVSMLVTNIYNLADTAFVGRLGTSESAAVGVIFGFMAIMQAFGFMFGQGGGNILARKMGAKDNEAASRYASTAFFGSLTTGFLIAIIGFFFINRIVYALGSTKTIFPYAKTYMYCILSAATFIVPSFTMNNLLRYEGKASLAMVGLMTGAVVNILLDPILIFGFHMGIRGAGVATAASQFLSFCILLSMFLRGKTQNRLALRFVFRSFRYWTEIMTTGAPSLIRQALMSTATIVMNALAGGFGDAAVAAMSIVSRVIMLLFSVGLGIGQGYQPVCSFNYGAKKYTRVRQGFRFAVILEVVILGIFAVFCLALSPYLVQVFRDDPEVIAIGTRALRLRAGVLVISPMIVLCDMTLQCSGKRLAAATMSILRNGAILIPLLLIMTHFFSLDGLIFAQPTADIISFVLSCFVVSLYFRRLPKESAETDEAPI